MNCKCHIPVVQKTVQKSGPNFGRSFFSCPGINDNKCDFFEWVNAGSITSSSSSSSSSLSSYSSSYGNNIINNNNLAYSNKLNNYLANEPKRTKPGSISMKLSLGEFRDNPNFSAWFTVICASSNILTKYYYSFPENKRKFDNNKKVWMFNFEIYEQFVSTLLTKEYDFVDLVELPRFLFQGIKKFIERLPPKILSIEDENPPNIHPSLLDTLMPFQLEGIKFIINRGGRGFIGDEMGCGKTIQAIGVIQHYREKWPALIIVPVSLLNQWNSELLNYSKNLLKATDVCIMRKNNDSIKGKICIVPYSMIDKLVENGKLKPEMFGIVIADESHSIKNKDAKRTLMTLPFLKKCPVSVCMSGTPATNRPVELYSQLNGLLPYIFSDYNKFTKRYCDAKESRFNKGLDVSGSSNEAELKLLLEGIVLIRRLKSDATPNLPPKIREVIYCDPDPAMLGELNLLHDKNKVLEKKIKEARNNPETLQRLKHEKDFITNKLYSTSGMSKVSTIKSELLQLIKESREERLKLELEDDLKKKDDNSPLDIDIDIDIDIDGDIENNSLEISDNESYLIKANKSKIKRKTNNNDINIKKRNKSENKCNDPKAVLSKIEEDFLCDSDSEIEFISSLNKNKNKDIDSDKDILIDSDEDELNDKSSTPLITSSSRRSSSNKSKIQPKSNKIIEDEDILMDSDGAMNIISSSSKNKRLLKNENIIDKRKLSQRLALQLASKKLIANNSCDYDTEEYNEDGEEDEDCHGQQQDNNDYDNNSDDYEDIFFRKSKSDNNKSKKSNITRKKNQLSEEEDIIEILDTQEFDEKDADSDVEDDENNLWKLMLENNSNNKNKNKKKGKIKKLSKKEEKLQNKINTRNSYRGLGKKIIVFAHHHDVMNAIEDILKIEEVNYIRIDGSISVNNRNSLVERFQEDDSTDVAVLSITAAGTGLNLTRAKVALFAELYWSPGNVMQAEDRIHRIGQKSSVRIIYLICRNAGDTSMWASIQKKHATIGATVGITDNRGKGLTINIQNFDSKDKNQCTLDSFMSNNSNGNSSYSDVAIAESYTNSSVYNSFQMNSRERTADSVYGCNKSFDQVQNADSVYGNNTSSTSIYGNNKAIDLVQNADSVYGNKSADSIYGGNKTLDLINITKPIDQVYGRTADVVYGNKNLDPPYGNSSMDSVYGQNAASLVNYNSSQSVYGEKKADSNPQPTKLDLSPRTKARIAENKRIAKEKKLAKELQSKIFNNSNNFSINTNLNKMNDHSVSYVNTSITPYEQNNNNNQIQMKYNINTEEIYNKAPTLPNYFAFSTGTGSTIAVATDNLKKGWTPPEAKKYKFSID
jgi:SNF2 family DNA or RNA helicase